MKRLFLFCLILLIFSCSVENSGSQKFLFEVEYTNDAWGYVLTGFYVDNEGNVFSYDHGDEEWQPNHKSFYTEKELQEKYSHSKQLVKTIDSKLLSERYDLVKEASRGPLSEPFLRCFDMGRLTYLAYRYETQTGKYEPIILHRAGSMAQKNISEGANSLFEWLNTIDNRFEDFSCQP
jgi:hypothetical protein